MGWFEDRRRKEENAHRRRKPADNEKRSDGIVEPSSEELLERKEKRLQERREGADDVGDLLEDLFSGGEPEPAGEPEPVALPDEEVEVPDARESLDVVEAAGRETDDFLSEMEEALAVPEFGGPEPAEVEAETAAGTEAEKMGLSTASAHEERAALLGEPEDVEPEASALPPLVEAAGAEAPDGPAPARAEEMLASARSSEVGQCLLALGTDVATGTLEFAPEEANVSLTRLLRIEDDATTKATLVFEPEQPAGGSPAGEPSRETQATEIIDVSELIEQEREASEESLAPQPEAPRYTVDDLDSNIEGLAAPGPRRAFEAGPDEALAEAELPDLDALEGVPAPREAEPAAPVAPAAEEGKHYSLEDLPEPSLPGPVPGAGPAFVRGGGAEEEADALGEAALPEEDLLTAAAGKPAGPPSAAEEPAPRPPAAEEAQPEEKHYGIEDLPAADVAVPARPPGPPRAAASPAGAPAAEADLREASLPDAGLLDVAAAEPTAAGGKSLGEVSGFAAVGRDLDAEGGGGGREGKEGKEGTTGAREELAEILAADAHRSASQMSPEELAAVERMLERQIEEERGPDEVPVHVVPSTRRLERAWQAFCGRIAGAYRRSNRVLARADLSWKTLLGIAGILLLAAEMPFLLRRLGVL